MNLKAIIALDSDEHVLLLVREAKIILLAKLLFWATLTTLPFLVDLLINNFVFDIGEEWVNVWQVIKNLYLLLSLLGVLIILVLYYLNVHIVTNKRVVDSDQISIIKHQTTEVYLDRVQDVSATITGAFAHIFNYGTVAIQSAGDIPKINFENVPDPKGIKRIILDAHYPYISPPNP